jgi:uncharacterized membrane protein
VTRTSRESAGLDSLLAGILQYGSFLATAVISVGLLLAFTGSGLGTQHLVLSRGTNIVTVGIALFIVLPVLRVLLMLIVYLRDRDYLLSVIAGLVLAIILLGLAIGSHMASPTAG